MTVDWEALRPPDHSPHLLVYNETVYTDEYHLLNLRARSERIRTVLDLGGNVGLFAIKVAEMFGEAHVHSFEPDPLNIAEFERHLRLAPQVAERIVLHQGGVWSERGTVMMNVGLAGCSWVEHGDGRPARDVMLEVPVLSLDDILEEFDEVDLLKCDIEGAEYDVIEAVSDEQLSKVRHFAAEIHWWDGAPRRREAFIAKMGDHFDLSGTMEGSGMLYGHRRG